MKTPDSSTFTPDPQHMHLENGNGQLVCVSSDCRTPVDEAILEMCRLFNKEYRAGGGDSNVSERRVAAVAMDNEDNFWIPHTLSSDDIDVLRQVCDDDFNQHIYTPWFSNRMRMIINRTLTALKQFKDRRKALKREMKQIFQDEEESRPETDKMQPLNRPAAKAQYLWFYTTNISDGLEPILTLQKDSDGRFYATRIESTSNEAVPLILLLAKLDLLSLKPSMKLFIQRHQA